MGYGLKGSPCELMEVDDLKVQGAKGQPGKCDHLDRSGLAHRQDRPWRLTAEPLGSSLRSFAPRRETDGLVQSCSSIRQLRAESARCSWTEHWVRAATSMSRISISRNARNQSTAPVGDPCSENDIRS
jgi:hypothetical protein